MNVRVMYQQLLPGDVIRASVLPDERRLFTVIATKKIITSDPRNGMTTYVYVDVVAIESGTLPCIRTYIANRYAAAVLEVMAPRRYNS